MPSGGGEYSHFMWWASCSRDYFDPMGTHLTTLGPLLWGAMVVRAPKDWGFEHYPQVMGAVPGISRNPAHRMARLMRTPPLVMRSSVR